MNFEAIKLLEDDNQVTTYAKMDLAVERGRGSKIWTSDGIEYIDLYGGHAVCATGHSHPHVVNAITTQAEKMLFYSNLVYSESRAKAAQKLVSIAPKGLTKAFFCNSGTEANENAMRMARLATGRQKIVSFGGGFHGRTADSISATFLGKYRKLGEPNVPLHIEAGFGDIDSIRDLINEEIAGVILEPIQSMAGMIEATADFFAELKIRCDSAGAMLIFDEVQTGIGRTGNWFFAGSKLASEIVPDIITLAKSLGSGIPVGACLVNEKITSQIKVNDLGTTFGGGMIAMAAVSATLEAIEQDEMIANARSIEQHLRHALNGHPDVVAVHGKGCLLGVEFKTPCAPIHKKLLDSRIITGTSSDPNILRLLPPLNTPLKDLEKFVEVINV